MKVTILSTYDKTGGAGIAAMRLLQSLNNNGVEAKMLVQDKKSDWNSIKSVSEGTWGQWMTKSRFILERLYFLPYEQDKSIRCQFSPAIIGKDISRHPLVQQADIIHIHWVNQGFMSIENMAQLGQLGKPIVWTLHDMWTFTGGCHYSGTCEGYKGQCGNCPYLKRPVHNDLSHHIWHKKKRMLNNTDIHFVTCSQWLCDAAKESSLLKDESVEALPNSIDTDLFKPIEKNIAKEQLDLATDKSYILFGALNVSDERKGFKYFKEAVEILAQEPEVKQNTEIMVFGKPSEELKNKLPLKVNSMGTVSDPKKIVAIYNAAETFVLPSLEDNLPNTIMEAMACGTPCVAFTTGGIPEMISHKQNGYLAQYQSSDDLATGLQYVLASGEQYHTLSNNAREKVVNSYSPEIIANKHLKLYENLLKG